MALKESAAGDAVRREREAAIDRLFSAVNAGDAEAAVDVFTHPRIEEIGLNRVYEGHDEVKQHLNDRRRAFPTQKSELIALHHADNAVIAEFWFTGQPGGEIVGIPSGGRSFRCRMASIFQFDATGLISQRVYFDVGTIARQLA